MLEYEAYDIEDSNCDGYCANGIGRWMEGSDCEAATLNLDFWSDSTEDKSLGSKISIQKLSCLVLVL